MLQFVSLVIFVVLTFMGLGIVLVNHGKERTGRYNFWISLITNGWLLYLFWFYYVN